MKTSFWKTCVKRGLSISLNRKRECAYDIIRCLGLAEHAHHWAEVPKVKPLFSLPSPGSGPGPRQRAPALVHQHHLPFTKYAKAFRSTQPSQPCLRRAHPRPRGSPPGSQSTGRFLPKRAPKRRSVFTSASQAPPPPSGTAPRAPQLPAPGRC